MGARFFTMLVSLGTACLLATAGPAAANSAGIFGKASSGCSCHGTGAPSPEAAVTIDAPAMIAPGQTADLTVTVDGPAPLPGALASGGFNLRASFGSLAAIDGTVQVQGTEAAHSFTGNDQRSWTVRWSFGNVGTICQLPFRAAANAVNGNGTNDPGDKWNLAAATIVVDASGDASDPDGTFRLPREGWLNITNMPIAETGTTVLLGETDVELLVEDDTGIASVEVFDTDALGMTSIGQAQRVGFSGGRNLYRVRWPAYTETPGSHTLTARITDCAGKVREVTLDLLVL